MAGAGLGWNENLPDSEPNGPWCDILEYEIAWALAGQPASARVIDDGSISYNFSAISTAEIKWKENSERGRKTASQITKTMMTNEGVKTVAIKAGADKEGGGGVPCAKEMIKAYIDHVMSKPLREKLPTGAPNEVFFSQGSGAHTDVCFIKGEVGAITDWFSYHAKHNVAPESRCIGLSQEGNSIFYNSQWSESEQEKAEAVEAAYETWGEKYSDDQGELTAALFIDKCTNDESFLNAMVNYIYERMVTLKATVIKSSCSAVPAADQEQIEYTAANGETLSVGVSNWTLQAMQNENWNMKGKQVRVVAHPSSSVQAVIEINTPVLVGDDDKNGQQFTDQYIPAFTLAFRQDPIRLNKLEELAEPLRSQRIAEVEAHLVSMLGQKIEWPDVMEWYRHEDIPAQIPRRKNKPDGPKKDNPLKVSEEILSKTTPLTTKEITKLKKGNYIAPEGWSGGWTVMEKEKSRGSGVDKYYVAVGDYPDDESLGHLETIPGDRVSRAAQVSATSQNLDQPVADSYIPKGDVMTERQRKIVAKALELIFENEDVSPEAKEDLMQISFDEFISMGDESIDEEAKSLSERWLKLAGILQG